jgi:hypothetical protein
MFKRKHVFYVSGMFVCVYTCVYHNFLFNALQAFFCIIIMSFDINDLDILIQVKIYRSADHSDIHVLLPNHSGHRFCVCEWTMV